jgi:hypothetical protein
MTKNEYVFLENTYKSSNFTLLNTIILQVVDVRYDFYYLLK